MGFCIFNNIAITARYIQEKYGIEKIMIIDWDVHHGNGTQNSFYDDGTVFYISLHQYPHYPGTGSKNETGKGKGKGYTLNFPMKSGSNDDDYLSVFRNEIVPAADDFKPGFVLISAGYDANARDPLSGIRLSNEVYADFTDIVLDIADKHADSKMIVFLEGGYDFKGLSQGVFHTINKMQSR
jgi:acetoin utilization deacetylase AcuC-like enzyme